MKPVAFVIVLGLLLSASALADVVDIGMGDGAEGTVTAIGVPEDSDSTGGIAVERELKGTLEFSQFVSANDTASDETTCIPHPTISIKGNHGRHGFTHTNPATGQKEYRAGSGVIDGSGSPQDPYLIAGWCIVPIIGNNGAAGGLGEDASISIQETDAHVVVAWNHVDGYPFQNVGFSLDRADNVTIMHNTATANGYGVSIRESNDAKITRNIIHNNTLDGIHVMNSKRVELSDNILRNNWHGGVHLSNVNELTVLNNTIAHHERDGIDSVDSSSIRVAHNLISSNDWDGVNLLWTTDVTFFNNTILHNGWAGIDVYETQRASFGGNTFRHNGGGLALRGSTNVTMAGNAFEDDGIGIYGGPLEHYRHDIGPSNTVNGEPVRYIQDQHDIEVPGPAGQVLLVNTTNATVSGLSLSNTTVGVQLAFTHNTTVTNNTIQGNSWGGVELHEAIGDALTHNSINNNEDDGVYLFRSRNITIAHTTVAGNQEGVLVYQSGGKLSYNNIYGNTEVGLKAWGGNDVIDARDNWWGAISGPSGGITDSCTGYTATGDGEKIVLSDGAELCFDPWLNGQT